MTCKQLEGLPLGQLAASLPIEMSEVASPRVPILKNMAIGTLFPQKHVNADGELMGNNTWNRLTDVPGLVGIPGVNATMTELSLKGMDPQDLGAVSFLQLLDGSVRVPYSDDFAIDVSKQTTVDIVNRRGVAVAGAAFSDPHPKEWIDGLAKAGRVVLLITPRDLAGYPTWREVHAEASVVLMPLALRSWGEGVGIVPPSN